MRPKLQPPRQWQDWASWVLGIWLILSPWLLQFWTRTPALENAVISGALLIAVEVLTLTAFRTWEEGVNVAIGVWLIASPFVLGAVGRVETINFVVVGILVVILALNELREVARHRAV